MKIMAGLIRRGRPATEVMRILAAEEAKLEAQIASTGRNDPCPCGSGRKLKQCHSRARANGQVKKRPLPEAQQRSTIRLNMSNVQLAGAQFQLVAPISGKEVDWREKNR